MLPLKSAPTIFLHANGALIWISAAPQQSRPAAGRMTRRNPRSAAEQSEVFGVHAAHGQEQDMTRVSSIVAMMLALAACETIEGFGEDVETGGEIIQDSAGDVQSDL